MNEVFNKPAKRADQLGHRPKRFWKEASVAVADVSFTVTLDGRALKTPGGAVLHVPALYLAEMIAAEWSAVASHVDYNDMPLTRLTFAAIDRMPQVVEETVAEALRYAQTDLLCHPSEYPEALTLREDATWHPVLAWVNQELGLEFVQNQTIIHRPQPAQTVSRLEGLVRDMTPFEQSGLMTAIPLLGSVVLALAVWRGHMTGEAAFAASRVGEDFQADIWGHDAEAEQRAAAIRATANSLDVWFKALR